MDRKDQQRALDEINMEHVVVLEYSEQALNLSVRSAKENCCEDIKNMCTSFSMIQVLLS